MFRETFAILKVINSINKFFIPTVLIKHIFNASLPFVNIIFSYLILDSLLLEESRTVILNYVYIMVGLNLIISVLGSLLNKLTSILVEDINLKLKAKVANKALNLDYEQIEKKENLELLYKVKEGSDSNGGIISFVDVFGSLFKHILTIIYSLILLSSLFIIINTSKTNLIVKIFNSPILAVILIFILFYSVFINYKIVKRINKQSYEFFEKNIEYNRRFFYFLKLTNNYKLGKDIRIYNMHEMITDEMNTMNNMATYYMRKFSKFNSKNRGLSTIVNQIIIYLTYLYVGIKAILGLISVGSVLKFVSALIIFNNALTNFVEEFASLDVKRKYLYNFCLFLNLESERYQGQLPIEKRTDNDYEIEFKNVSFHYPNNKDMILNNVSLKIKIGEKIAIVGMNGAGKTTFIKLLCRLYDPTQGEILLNGINIKKYDYKEYLDIFSVVFQDFKLFSFNIAQNVATSINYKEDLIWKTLEQTGIKDRVLKMKDGINTRIYQIQEKGIEISGGEAQKIAIARALYKDAPIVILDEPTSALDPLSEYEIYSNFDGLVNNKTALYISHRMSSCRFCDNIIVFDEGKIVQCGSHETLMLDTNNLYFRLWNAQAKYYQL